MARGASRRVCVAVLLLAGALACGRAVAGEFQDDLKARRAQVMERIPRESIFIHWSAPVRNYSRSVDYEFRQDSNFYYLTGIDQEESILVMMPGNQTHKEILFIKPRNPVREHWQGRLLSRDEAAGQSGVKKILLTTDFEPFVNAVLGGRPYAEVSESAAESGVFFDALKDARARLALVLDSRTTLNQPLPDNLLFANKARERFPGFSVFDASVPVHELRQIKTPFERKLIERSVDISSEAQMAGMRATRPGVYEYEVRAAIEQVYRARGAQGWSYPPIVGSGPNATILHYTRSSRRMEAGDLLLVDAAGNYEYLTGDITRTWPVNGSFSDAQKDIYRLVLAAQEAGMQAARTGARLSDIHTAAGSVLRQGLLKLGLVTDADGDQFRTWFTHNTSHWIGMDVHDVGDRARRLEPGMAFVIEPGIYIQPSALDNLPKTKENLEFIARVRPAFEKYKNIGIRIEDSFLLTETGLKNLSARVPRTIDEVERYMKGR